MIPGRILPIGSLAIALLIVSPVFPDRSLPADPIEGVGTPTPACTDGVIKDDGSLETGWGWVPSVQSGEYVQVYDRSEFRSRRLESVCVCWLRTRTDDSIDFDVVFYEESNEEPGQPAEAPFAAVPTQATSVPQGIVGAFYQVDVRGVTLPEEGTIYIGPRWNASADQFFFLCADTTPETPFTNVFFIDDRAKGEWSNIAETSDPIFQDHRAVLVRPVAGVPAAVEIPTLGAWSRLSLVLLLAGLAWTWSRR